MINSILYKEELDTRWVCWKCGDLDYLSEKGLCSDCRPDKALEFYEVSCRIQSGEGPELKPRWKVY